jgi:hypothetical protein
VDVAVRACDANSTLDSLKAFRMGSPMKNGAEAPSVGQCAISSPW